jgi:hypothetical protein
MKLANKASRQLFAWLLAIDDGGMEITKKASRYSSAWLLAISKSRNEYCQHRIRTLVCSPACYWYEWKSPAKHWDKSLFDSLLSMTKEWKSLTKHPDTHLLACWLAKVWMNITDKASGHSSAWLLAIWWGQNENCQRIIQAVLCSIAGYLWQRNEYHRQSIQTLVCLTARNQWRK